MRVRVYHLTLKVFYCFLFAWHSTRFRWLFCPFEAFLLPLPPPAKIGRSAKIKGGGRERGEGRHPISSPLDSFLTRPNPLPVFSIKMAPYDIRIIQCTRSKYTCNLMQASFLFTLLISVLERGGIILTRIFYRAVPYKIGFFLWVRGQSVAE